MIFQICCSSDKGGRPSESYRDGGEAIISLDEVKLDALQIRYEVDRFLNLTLKQKVRVRFNASLSLPEYSGSKIVRTYIPLPNGDYQFRLALDGRTEDQTQIEPIEYLEGIVQSHSGILTTEVELGYRDLKILRMRNRLYVALGGTGRTKHFTGCESGCSNRALKIHPALTSGFWIPSENSTGVILSTEQPSLNSFESLIAMKRDYHSNYVIQMERIANSRSLARAMHLDEFNMEDRDQLNSFLAVLNKPYLEKGGSTIARSATSDLARVNPKLKVAPASMADLYELYESGTVRGDFGLRICYFWLTNFLLPIKVDFDFFLNQCSSRVFADPQYSMFDVSKIVNINEIKSAQFIGGRTMNIHTMKGSKTSVSTSQKYVRGLHLNPLGLIMGLFRDTMGVTIQLHWTTEEIKSTAFDRQYIIGKYLILQEASFALQSEYGQSCTVVRAKPGVLNEMSVLSLADISSSQLKILERGLILCSELAEHKPLSAIEHYYHINQQFDEGDLLDRGEWKNQPWVLTLRGLSARRQFLDFVSQSETNSVSFPMTHPGFIKLGHSAVDLD